MMPIGLGTICILPIGTLFKNHQASDPEPTQPEISHRTNNRIAACSQLFADTQIDNGGFSQQVVHKVHNASGVVDGKGTLMFSIVEFPSNEFSGLRSLANATVAQKANAKSKNTFFMLFERYEIDAYSFAFRRSRPTSFGVVSGNAHSCNCEQNSNPILQLNWNEQKTFSFFRIPQFQGNRMLIFIRSGCFVVLNWAAECA